MMTREGSPIPMVHNDLKNSHNKKILHAEKERQEDLEELHQMY
jgi:hypothetical protein